MLLNFRQNEYILSVSNLFLISFRLFFFSKLNQFLRNFRSGTVRLFPFRSGSQLNRNYERARLRILQLQPSSFLGIIRIVRHVCIKSHTRASMHHYFVFFAPFFFFFFLCSLSFRLSSSVDSPQVVPGIYLTVLFLSCSMPFVSAVCINAILYPLCNARTC